MVYVAAGGAASVALLLLLVHDLWLVMQSTVNAMLLRQSMLHVPHNHMTLTAKCRKFPAVLETTGMTCHM